MIGRVKEVDPVRHLLARGARWQGGEVSASNRARRRDRVTEHVEGRVVARHAPEAGARSADGSGLADPAEHRVRVAHVAEPGGVEVESDGLGRGARDGCGFGAHPSGEDHVERQDEPADVIPTAPTKRSGCGRASVDPVVMAIAIR